MFIEVRNLNKTYKAGNIDIKALKDVSFSMNMGEIAVILGPSGSGKSTLINTIGGIDRAGSGSIIVDNVDITGLNDKNLTEYRRASIGFIFQFYNLIPNLTVYENVEVSANISENPMDIMDILSAVGMKEMKDRFPRELSGGQQQRVSIARAIIKNPKLLLCDEPTGALDFSTSKDILTLLADVNKRFNTTIFLITHNTAIGGFANRIIKLRSGEIAEDYLNENKIPAERIEW